MDVRPTAKSMINSTQHGMLLNVFKYTNKFSRVQKSSKFHIHIRNKHNDVPTVQSCLVINNRRPLSVGHRFYTWASPVQTSQPHLHRPLPSTTLEAGCPHLAACRGSPGAGPTHPTIIPQCNQQGQVHGPVVLPLRGPH